MVVLVVVWAYQPTDTNMAQIVYDSKVTKSDLMHVYQLLSRPDIRGVRGGGIAFLMTKCGKVKHKTSVHKMLPTIELLDHYSNSYARIASPIAPTVTEHRTRWKLVDRKMDNGGNNIYIYNQDI